jgi:hypothetical protein
MQLPYDPAIIRAVLSTEGDHWTLALEHAEGGSWGHADVDWHGIEITRDELSGEIGEEALADVQQVIGLVEVSLRRSGWRAERGGTPVHEPTLEIWDLSPASDYR